MIQIYVSKNNYTHSAPVAILCGKSERMEIIQTVWGLKQNKFLMGRCWLEKGLMILQLDIFLYRHSQITVHIKSKKPDLSKYLKIKFLKSWLVGQRTKALNLSFPGGSPFFSWGRFYLSLPVWKFKVFDVLLKLIALIKWPYHCSKILKVIIGI